jgi:hypothetical protein
MANTVSSTWHVAASRRNARPGAAAAIGQVRACSVIGVDVIGADTAVVDDPGDTPGGMMSIRPIR